MRIPVALIACTAIACSNAAAPRAPQTERVTTTAAATTRSAPAAAVRYVAIGASDTVGVGARDPATGSWPARLAAKLPPGSTYLNLGVSGSLVAGARAEQLPRALREKPTLVTIWLAVNDITNQVPLEQYTADLSAIVDAIVQGTDARVFVGTVPDLRAVPAFNGIDRAALKNVIDAYNGVIAQVAAKHASRAVAVDLYRGSADLTSSLTVTEDGLHPTDHGYELIADRFAESIRAAGYALR